MKIPKSQTVVFSNHSEENAQQHNCMSYNTSSFTNIYIYIYIYIIIIIISSNLSNDRSKVSSKTIPPHSAT